MDSIRLHSRTGYKKSIYNIEISLIYCRSYEHSFSSKSYIKVTFHIMQIVMLFRVHFLLFMPNPSTKSALFVKRRRTVLHTKQHDHHSNDVLQNVHFPILCTRLELNE